MLGNHLLGRSMQAGLEVYGSLWSKTAENTDGFHDGPPDGRG